MPGMLFIDNILWNGKLQAMFKCDRCKKHFAFEDGEHLYCPNCKENGYPLNRDPEEEAVSILPGGPGKSRLIIPGGDITKPIK